MYNALCCSIFTPDLDVSGGVPGAKSGTAQAVPVVSPPTPLQLGNSSWLIAYHRIPRHRFTSSPTPLLSKKFFKVNEYKIKKYRIGEI